jgi:hypothetical protein
MCVLGAKTQELFYSKKIGVNLLTPIHCQIYE